MNCKKCDVELTELNQYPSDRSNYSHICKSCKSKIRKDEYLKNREKLLKQKKDYYITHRKERLEYHHIHKEEILVGQRRRQRGYKVKTINHYSNGTMACANPFGEHKEPYTTIEALSIDHINGGGTQERIHKSYGKGGSFYFWLIKQGFPEGYQVLCMNCQFIKKIRNKEGSNK